MSISVPTRLLEKYQKDGIVLFFGAGVSINSDLPDWPTLLKSIYERVRAITTGAPSHSLLKKNLSVTVLGGVLEEVSRRAGLDFAEVVRESLYLRFPFFGEDVRKPGLDRKFKAYVYRKNHTLRAVSAMMAVSSRSSFKSNPRIRAVVNFNLDATFRSFVGVKYGRIIRTIERPSAGARLGRINIYYPHGFLDFDSSSFGRLDKEAPDRLVLSEHSYFDFFNRPTEMFTYTLLYLLREYTCVFVGMSMQDDNLRRLLHYSFQERILGYQKEGGSLVDVRHRCCRHFCLLLRPKNREFENWQEQSLLALGVSPIWIDDFSQIPTVFKALYNSSGKDWGSVWS